MPGQLSTGDLEIRHQIYRFFAEHGRAPRSTDLVRSARSAEDVCTALIRLHEAHAIVLEPGGSELRMALPFAAIDTGHTVRSGGASWWANCAWDALAIPIALGIDAVIEATWLDDATPVGLDASNGELSSYDGFIHFCVCARQWWDDIVET